MTGRTFTKPRARSLSGEHWTQIVCAALILCYLLTLARSATQGLWIVDRKGAPVLADFSVYWGAARLTWLGRAASAYDWNIVRATIEQMSGKPFPAGDFPFFYPPLMLLILTPLGGLAYVPAAALWISVTFAAYIRAAFAILKVRGLLIAGAAPAALWCICVGQNGVLSAALLGGALVLLDRRPTIAGMLIALMSFKPQLGVLIPLVLIASGRWRVFASAAVSCAALWLTAGALFGFATYPAFLNATAAAGHIFMIAGELPWFKMQSVFGLLRTVGAPAGIASLAQIAVSLCAGAGTVVLWRSNARYALKAASLAVGALALSPYVQIYDFPIATIAVLFLAADGEAAALRRWQIAAIVAGLLLPLAIRFVDAPLGPAVLALLGSVIAARSLKSLAADSQASHQENLAQV